MAFRRQNARGSLPRLRRAVQLRELGWQLGDSVPSIDLSGTLNYGGPSFDDKGVDGLRLAYKLFVLLPVLTVVYEVFRARPAETGHPAGGG
jgi:hypothetical protein